jgi:hypothetical protein
MQLFGAKKDPAEEEAARAMFDWANSAPPGAN